MQETQRNRSFSPIPEGVENVAKAVLDAAFVVHSNLGPGLLESVYETCLAYEIRQSGLSVESQVYLPVIYKSQKIEAGLRLDLLVGNCLIVEIKATEDMKLLLLYEAQVLTYLKLTGFRLGLLINFNVYHLKDGIKRIIL